MKAEISDLNTDARYKKIFAYREKLMKHPNSLRPQIATKQTAEYFEVTIQTVYNAIRKNRR